MTQTDRLIDDLAGSLKPVRPVSPGAGRAMIAGVAALTVTAVALLYGLRADVSAVQPHAMLLMSSGLFFLLGAAGGWSLTRMARPAVGAGGGTGWRWALAAVLLLPVAAAIQMVVLAAQRGGPNIDQGLDCLSVGVTASVGSAVMLTLWLRRGAPVAIGTAAWLVGLTAGAIGAVAVALICAHDGITHIGIWHAAIPLVSGVAARLVLPRFLSW